MRKNLKFLSIVILTLAFVVSPALAEATTTPTEIERVKDYYYFKIHGGPLTPYLEHGKAEFTYKNLSTKNQTINVVIERTWSWTVPPKHDFVEFPRKLVPGEEYSSWIDEDFGVTVYFELYIDNSLAFNSTIWVPPPQS